MAVSSSTSKQQKMWKTFIINVSLVIVIFVLGMFLWIFSRNKNLINQQMLSRARAHFNSIVLTRRWNAGFGGVYVEKKEGIISNPYLENPDFEAQDGTIYTKKNPALMTREISELAVSDSRRGRGVSRERKIGRHF